MSQNDYSSQNDYIGYVSPHYGDLVKASGYRFTCPSCGWVSPVTRFIEGARRHRRTHKCGG